MKLEIGFGTTPQIVELPDKNIDGILYPNEVTVATTGAEEVNRSLSHPIGTRSLEEIVKGKERIVIVTSDITRPMPSHVVLPQLLERMYAAGVKPESITIVFALGSHRTQTEEKNSISSGNPSTARCAVSIPRNLISFIWAPRPAAPP